MVTSELSEFLRRIRERKNISQSEAARRTGINKSVISRYESGERIPNPAHLVLLAEAYETDRHFVLLHAGIVELIGFEMLTLEAEAEDSFDQLLASATLDEKRQLIKYLASIRMTSPLIDEFFENEDEGEEAS